MLYGNTKIYRSNWKDREYISIPEHSCRPRTHSFKSLQITFILVLSTILCSCAVIPKYPHESEIRDGSALPIDGDWRNEKGLAFKIERGKMFSLVKSSIGLPPGSVIAKGIRRTGPGKFECAKESYNKNTGYLDYGEGLLTLLPSGVLQLYTFPNPKTGFSPKDPLILHNIRLADEASFRAELATMQRGNPKVLISEATSVKSGSPAPENNVVFSGVKAIGVRWAVVIGISKHKDSQIPSLRYASADAKAIYGWLVSPTGGRISPTRARLLLDERATGAAIKDALFNWLGQALEEDIVTIYFAGHGSPQSPDQAQNLFLLPYDADYSHIATTGFPMWDIETALKRFIKAKKVIVIADACHSGGIGSPFDVALRNNRSLKINPVTTALHGLSNVGAGICVISASDDHQFSQESQEWGGGHGVFTYFLLKGIKGEADYNKDGKINLGELIPYLSEQVRRATGSAQSPTVAGKFDPALTIGE